MSSKKKVLVIGGTGYLGQHLLQSLSEENKSATTTDLLVAFTHHSNPPPHQLLRAIPNSIAFQVDLRNRSWVRRHFQRLWTDPVAAMSINVPSALVKWLSDFKENKPLLVHLSTDQVYEGLKPFYKEDDETVPVNIYGKSKVEAEQFISANYSNFAILRSSIIFGPQTISPVPKSLPIQWMDTVLSKGDNVEFFHDEFRCPVFVKDVVSVILKLVKRWISEAKEMQLLLNVGGPDRVSRAQMAEAVALVRGYNKSLIKSVSASSIDRGVKSPPDISMDISKMIQELGISPLPFTDGVRLTLAAEASS